MIVWTAALKEPQKLCQSSGLPKKVSKCNLDNRLAVLYVLEPLLTQLCVDAHLVQMLGLKHLGLE